MVSSRRWIVLHFLVPAVVVLLGIGQSFYWNAVFRMAQHEETAGRTVHGALLINVYAASFLCRWGWLIVVALAASSILLSYILLALDHRKGSAEAGPA